MSTLAQTLPFRTRHVLRLGHKSKSLQSRTRPSCRGCTRDQTATVRTPVAATRHFSVITQRRTDGVFRELTNERVAVPWVEALRKRDAAQNEKHGADVVDGAPKTTQETELTPKRMKDSYYSVVLPLAQDKWLGDSYLNSSGHVRLGSLFMDLDALSGVVAYKHTGPGVTTVTAAFDRITVINSPEEICDLELSGQVNWVGRSSMEIFLQVAKISTPGQKPTKDDVLISCTCSMVSLDPVTKRSKPINPLIVETEEEKRLFAAGEANSATKKELGKVSLLKHTPNDEESDLIHHLWQKQIQWHDPNDPERTPTNVIPMEQTVLRTAAIMQPQYRNRHQFMIFGGFLLKQTFELAFCCAASFSHTRPSFISLDPSTFQNPVPVGSVLYLTATVVYTDPPAVSGPSDSSDAPQGKAASGRTRIMVRVDSKVRNVEHGESKPTGQFNFSFYVDRDLKVMPRTYTEFMVYVDARRRAKRVAELCEREGIVMGGSKGVTE